MSCHSDLIVCVNIPSDIYHFPGQRPRRTENSCASEMRTMKVIGQRASNEPFTTGSAAPSLTEATDLTWGSEACTSPVRNGTR
jgi:hypothetical protein